MFPYFFMRRQILFIINMKKCCKQFHESANASYFTSVNLILFKKLNKRTEFGPRFQFQVHE